MAARNLLTTSAALGLATAARLNCTSTSIATPTLYGAEIQSLVAAPVRNYSSFVTQNGASPSFNTLYTGLDFCNVTVTYTHPGWHDTINVKVWLPLSGWNGRFQGTGGSGWMMGGDYGLAAAVALGYSAATSDGGHPDDSDAAASPSSWGLDSPGNVNLGLLQDFASTGLNDLAIIGKAVTRNFYGTPANYSYWVGCSTGGRQGLMLAQRYPDLFDGIIADNPAMDWDKLPISTYWNQHIADLLDYHAPACELESIRLEAVQICDGLDGVVDGVISDPDLCTFNATWAVGKPATACNGTNQTISWQAAVIANNAWSGPVSAGGEPLFYGLQRDAHLSVVANTTCNGTTADSCVANSFTLGPDWMNYFLAKDPDFDYTNITSDEYRSMFHSSVDQYASIIGTRWPDLSKFRAAGGKMISTHGTADQVIPHKATEEYYRSVLALDEEVADYYRFFIAPGDGHCGVFSTGHHANDTLGQLVRWVEHGEAPETLVAVSQTEEGIAVKNGTVRRLCPYPKRQRYHGGDPGREESFGCV